MPGHPIENIMKTTMENIKEMIDVNTIVGDAVETADGSVIIPISRVSFGFVAGGGEYKEKNKEQRQGKSNNDGDGASPPMPFAGGTGAGVSVNPIAFLVVGEGKIRLLPVQFSSPTDRIVELIPDLLEEVKEMTGHKKESKKIITTEDIKQ
ncbi:MAG: sporulation protein YtfJ [Clostridiales bacterium]|nr:sporulation protein YtfJ [Clostridiales bacterium]